MQFDARFFRQLPIDREWDLRPQLISATSLAIGLTAFEDQPGIEIVDEVADDSEIMNLGTVLSGLVLHRFALCVSSRK